MKKLGLCILSLMFVLTLAPVINAGDVASGNNADSAKAITISGSVDLPLTYRDGPTNDILEGNPTNTTVDKMDHDVIWAPLITLNADIDLADKVTALVQLENRRLDFAGGVDANTDILGADNTEMAVEQAYVKVGQFINEKLSLTLGLQDLKFTLRKGEGAFFMDISESETIIAPPLAEAVTVSNPVFKDTTEFGGFRFDYGSVAKDNYEVTLFWGGAAFQRSSNFDNGQDNLFGVNVNYKQSDTITINGILAKITNKGKWPGSRSNKVDVQTIGGGVDWKNVANVANLDGYAEYYTQSGTYGQYQTGATTWDDVDHSASAYRFGVVYTFNDINGKPYVGLSTWNISGDDGENQQLAGAASAPENNDFVSYESVNDTMIMENNLFGLDLDSNYTALKLNAGIETSFDIDGDKTGEPVHLKLTWAKFTLNEEPVRAGVAWNAPRTNIDDALGTEIDISATIHYNASLSFTLGLAQLTGADFFTSANGANTADSDDLKMVTFDTYLRF